jgi:hypothetical protein
MKIQSILSLAITLVATGGLASANLITNGDFETGDFTGWTVTPAATFSDIEVLPGFPPDTTFGANFGASGTDLDSISQTFATTPGAFYTLTFFYQVHNPPGVPPNNEFNVLFNGVSPDTSLFPQSDANSGFGTFTFTNLQATGTMTTLEFLGRNAPGFDILDNVSVTASRVPDTGSTLGLLFVSVTALFGLNRLRHVQLA